MNNLLNRTRKKRCFPELFKDDENIITNKIDIATKFNSFYADIGPKLAQNICMPSNKCFKDYLANRCKLNFKFENVNTDTVKEIVNNLKSKTSLGYDGISTKLLKTIQNILLEPLTVIINQMLCTGIFPDKLKI